MADILQTEEEFRTKLTPDPGTTSPAGLATGQGNTPSGTDEAYWKNKLTEEQYRILREKGTEAPFSGKFLQEKGKGTFNCVACGNPLFSSSTKFDSGTGWPSFDDAIQGAVKFEKDDAYGMNRTEVLCSTCGSHLGHVFTDGPTQTGKRYCINSVCLGFEEKE